MRLMNQRYIILEDIMWTPHLVSFLSFLFQHIFSLQPKTVFSNYLQHILSTWCVIISFVSSNGIHIYYTSPITLKHELCTCGTLKDMKKQQHRALKSQTVKGVILTLLSSPHYECDYALSWRAWIVMPFLNCFLHPQLQFVAGRI